MHGRLRIPQIETQVFRQGLNGGLASIIRGIARWIGYTLLRSRNYNRTWCTALLKRWDEGIEAIDDAEEIGTEDL